VGGTARAVDAHRAWDIEASKDGDDWNSFGTGWTHGDEPLLVHGLPAFARLRPSGDTTWSGALGRDGDHPISLLTLDEPSRRELWPSREHIGLPVLLPGGEVGRLLRFDHADDGSSWNWAVEFANRRQR
jgi:hypothetical protein